MKWVSKYIGIQFESHGRTLEKCDCFGLVRQVLLNEKNIKIDSFEDDYLEANELKGVEKAIYKNIEIAQEIKENEAIEFDLVFFRIKGVVCHIGIVINPILGTFLHTMRNKNSHIANYKSKMFNKRIEGFFRL